MLPSVSVIYWKADEIISNNRFAREHATDVFPIGEENQPWPENYFVIGDNGAGDYWYIHRDSAAAGVWFYECESHKIWRMNTSLDDYLADLRKDMENPEDFEFDDED